MNKHQLRLSHFNPEQGKAKPRSKTYKRYDERAAMALTKLWAKSGCGVRRLPEQVATMRES